MYNDYDTLYYCDSETDQYIDDMYYPRGIFINFCFSVRFFSQKKNVATHD